VKRDNETQTQGIKTMRKSATIKLSSIRRQLDAANELLASAIPQSSKATICCMIEALLNEANLYKGFNCLYWTTKGCAEWQESGRNNDKSKRPLIYGPEGVDCKPEFVSDIQGEYSRRYYIHNEL